MLKVFIDGKAGTTGLKLLERLSNRKDIELLIMPEEYRKDLSYRKEFINKSDIAFLCLPDVAAIEAVSLVDNSNTKIIDASTAHRTNTQWAYGFPELGKDFREKIVQSNRVAVPGCHASGFLSIVYPLIKMGILPKDYPLVCHSITGYSGGGKNMIAEYTDVQRNIEYQSPRQYALNLEHKHLREMKAIPSLSYVPIFNPIVGDFYSGMEVTVPLYTRLLNNITCPKQMFEALSDYYKGQNMVSVKNISNNFMPSNAMSDTNKMEIFVGGNDERIELVALFDNLGKGASGAAVQCMNIMSGYAETTGLI
jgi:N-acetyl-gamma-glutamyl-phosphate reductase